MQDFNEMKKDKAKRITGFFGILVALILVFSGVLTDISMKDDNLIQSRNKSMAQIQKQKKNSIDMIVVGDSLSYSAISPMQLWNSYGYSSFVCAQSGQRIQETYSMLQTAFENQKPKLVIMETNPMFRVREKVRRFSLPCWKPAIAISRFSAITMCGSLFFLENNTQSRDTMDF